MHAHAREAAAGIAQLHCPTRLRVDCAGRGLIDAGLTRYKLFRRKFQPDRRPPGNHGSRTVQRIDFAQIMVDGIAKGFASPLLLMVGALTSHS